MSNTTWIIILSLCVGANLYTIHKGNHIIGGFALSLCVVSIALRVAQIIK